MTKEEWELFMMKHNQEKIVLGYINEMKHQLYKMRQKELRYILCEKDKQEEKMRRSEKFSKKQLKYIRESNQNIATLYDI